MLVHAERSRKKNIQKYSEVMLRAEAKLLKADADFNIFRLSFQQLLKHQYFLTVPLKINHKQHTIERFFTRKKKRNENNFYHQYKIKQWGCGYETRLKEIEIYPRIYPYESSFPQKKDLQRKFVKRQVYK